MKRKYQRYEQSELEQVIKNCSSFTEACRKMNRKPVGGTITNMRLMCRRWNIDVSHMVGSAHNRGKKSKNRLTPTERLVMGSPNDHRVEASKLRRALFEINVEYKCKRCGIADWNNEPLVLEIDHIDNQYWNNTRENLQFLCPNCHSQKK